MLFSLTSNSVDKHPETADSIAVLEVAVSLMAVLEEVSRARATQQSQLIVE